MRRVASNASWLALERVTRMAVGLLIGVWIARYLGPAQYGQLAYVIAFVALFQTIVSLGIDSLVVRELANRISEPGAIVGTVLRLRVAAAAICVATACMFMAVARPGDQLSLLLTVLISASMLFQPADVVDLWFISESKSRGSVLARLAALALASAVKVVLLATEQPLWTFATTQVLEAAFAAVALAIAYRQHPVGRPWSWSAGVARGLVKEGWPVLLSALSIFVYMRIDQLMLRNFSGESQLGLYSAMLPFSQALNFVAVTVCGSAAPYLVRLHAENPELFERRVRQLFFVMFWSAALIATTLSALSGPIVGLFLGPQYLEAGPMLAIHAFTNIAVFMGVAQVLYLTTTRRTRVFLMQSAAGAVVSAVANLALVPRFGGQGAATAAVLSYFVSGVLANSLVARPLFIMQIQSIWVPRVR